VSEVDDIPHERRFHFQDGSDAKNLAELKRKIETMPYHEFYRHVNAEKNDFANWVEHVIADKALANKLRSVTSIVETVELLNEELNPEDVLHAEEELKQRQEDDLQERIEHQLFHEPQSFEQEQVPDFEIEIGLEQKILPEVSEVAPALPSREEVAFQGRVPGAPVTTRASPHVSARERFPKEEEPLQFVVKHFIYGFLFGIIIGLILGRIVSLLL